MLLLLARVLVILALLAGCVTKPGDADAALALPDSAILAELGARAGTTTAAGDALVLPLRATPEGAVAAAWWTIPEGGLVEGSDGLELRLVGAPLGADGAEVALERWLLLAFTEQPDGLALHGFAFGAPIHATRGDEEQTLERSLGPFPFAMSELSPGERLGLAFAAVSERPVDVAVVLAPLVAVDAPPETREAFLEGIAEAQRIALPMIEVAAPHTFTLLNHGTAAMGEQTLRAGTAEVEHSTTGVGPLGLREVRVSNAFPSRGYTFAFAAYSNDAGVGEWSSTFDMHGTVTEDAGEVRNVAGTALEDVPLAAAAGEGEAAATGELRARVTSVATADTLVYFSIDVGATLTELLGVAAAPVEPGDVTMGGARSVGGPFNDLMGNIDLPFRLSRGG